MTKKHIIAYTDGSSLGNPGPGGYGAILRYGGHYRELSGGFRCTTNNRMEILAAIEALKALKEPCRVSLHTDSQYLANAVMKGWVRRWRRNGWMRNKKEPALNADLWVELLPLLERHDVEFIWVRGHAGDPANERCDALAKEAAEQPNLPPDPGYDGDNACA
jgi:ribonuclease HI